MALKKKILLVGSNDRAALACARSLSVIYDIHIARFTAFKNVACYSNSVTDSFYVGSPNTSLSDVLMVIENMNSHHRFDFILPVTDEALIVVEYLRKRSDFPSSFLIPDSKDLDVAQDKYLIKEICEDIPELFYPETELLTSGMFKDCNNIIAFPVYLKTRKSSFIIDDYIYSYNVKKINNKVELENYLRDVLVHVDVLVQKTIEGKGLGLNVFSINGRVIGESVNERLHEPKGGGGGVYRKTRMPNSTESQIISKIVNRLGWTGPLMIELKKTKQGWCLIELNCRFWGSLTGTIFSGHDYPLLYTKLFEGEELRKLPNAKPITSRNLLKDLSWTIKNKKLFEFFKLLISPLDVLRGKDIYDVERASDLVPAFMQFLVKFMQLNLSRKINRMLNILSLRFKFQKMKVITASDFDQSLIFICRGNVNRSVFAKYYFEKLTSNPADSKSTLRLEKRKCSSLAQIVALSEHSIDLSEHRSESVISSQASPESIYVCMDYKNVLDLFELGVPKNQIKMLSNSEIQDPHGRSIRDFKECFYQISSSIEGVFSETEKFNK